MTLRLVLYLLVVYGCSCGVGGGSYAFLLQSSFGSSKFILPPNSGTSTDYLTTSCCSRAPSVPSPCSTGSFLSFPWIFSFGSTTTTRCTNAACNGAVALRAATTTTTTTDVKVAHEIFMPALSSTMNEGRVIRWNKQVGDRVEVGDTVMVVESDKADMDVESFSEGYMASQLVGAGETALVGSTVGLLAERFEDIADIQKQGLNPNAIPSGDNSRHHGTTAWSVEKHHAAKAPLPPSPAPVDFASPAELSMMGGAHEIFMPALSGTMVEGRIAKWHKKEGDKVNVNDIVMVVESDKADMDVESFEEGYMAKILVPQGANARVGATVALLAKTAEEIESVRKYGLQGIHSGSDKRHDMTTAVFSKSFATEGLGAATSSGGATLAPVTTAAAEPSPVSSIDVYMPTLSSTMTEGRITKWNKAVGDKVQPGHSLMVVESDKADIDVECFDEGYLGAILTPENNTAKVGDCVALIVQSKEDVETLQKYLLTSTSSAEGKAPAPPVPASGSVATPVTLTGRHSDAFSLPQEVPETPREYRIPSFVPESLDQEVSGQVPKGVTSSDLENEFLSKAMSTPEGRAFIEELQETEKGKVQLRHTLERVRCRQPPSNNLLNAHIEGFPQSVWRISLYARQLAAKLRVDLKSVAGSGPRGRILAEDVERAAAEQKNHRAYSEPAMHQITPIATLFKSATPTARRLVKQHGVDFNQVKGTGPFDRVTADDVRQHLGLPPEGGASAAPASRSVTPVAAPMSSIPTAGLVPLSGIQKAIAKNMEATINVPVFRVSYNICTDSFDKLYTELRSRDVTLSAMIAKAVSLALEKHPLLNAAFDAKSGSVRNPGGINIAMAVATEGGLMTPVLAKANEKDIYTLSRTWKSLIDKAKKKALSRDEYSTGTFVISNLGMFGVSHFEAILPEKVGSILAIGASKPVVRVEDNGLIAVHKYMTATITCDHRHIYGAHAAEFLRELADIMENRLTELLT